MMKFLDTAVLFLIFNRPETTSKVFEAIKQAKPNRLYVAADGPRENKDGEKEIVDKVRSIATLVDWPCEVKTLFRTKNLGCQNAIGTAITWFFEQEEKGIILEDDCLPNTDFFYFCHDLLLRFNNDKRVSAIHGNDFQNGYKNNNESYFFSKYFHCWGWATWRRTWKYYDGNINFWNDWKKSVEWKNFFNSKNEKKYWENIFDRVYFKKVNSWVYPFQACLWKYGQLIIAPNKNLVSNIGYGVNATSTFRDDGGDNLPKYELGVINHPESIKLNIEFDNYEWINTFGGKNFSFPRRELIFVKKILFNTYLKIIKFLKK